MSAEVLVESGGPTWVSCNDLTRFATYADSLKTYIVRTRIDLTLYSTSSISPLPGMASN